MGKFSDNLRKRKAEKRLGQAKSIEFLCENCLNQFQYLYEDIFLNEKEDLEFVPEPSCPRCGSVEDIFFSDYGQEKIEDMLLNGAIRKRNIR